MTAAYDVRYFLARVAEVDGCILWTGAVSDNSYPRMMVERGKYIGAHIWVWRHLHGPIPDGFDIDHICHVRICVNPNHLEAKPREENRAEGWLRHARRSRRDAVLTPPEPLAFLLDDDNWAPISTQAVKPTDGWWQPSLWGTS